MGKYEQLAKEIVRNIGGRENVSGLTHCITRLRFKLRDEKKANDDVLKKMDGVVTVMKSGGQYQVVIGNHVPEVYEDVMELLGPDQDGTAGGGAGGTAGGGAGGSAGGRHADGSPGGGDAGEKGSLFNRAIDVISGIFQPILGIMAACGMVKGLNALFVAMGLYTAAGGGYLILNAVGDGLFYFLPLFLGYTAAKKFGLKPMIGLVIGAIMCYPSVQAGALSAGGEALYTLFAGSIFESEVYMEFFGIPMIAMDYTGTVIPVIFVVYFASLCEKFFSRFVPDLVKFFFVPMLTLLVAVPAGFIVIGPLAVFGSTVIATAVMTVRNFSPMLAGAIVGLTWQILVIFGLHWGFIPVYINNIMTLGYDNVMMPFFACTFATSAAVLAVFFKTKDRKLKEMALPNFISGIFGVTEPAIYGITLPLKTPFVISCIAGCIGGGFYGAFNFRKFMMGGMGIFEFPAMIEPDGGMGNLIVAVVGVAITMAVAFGATMVFYKDKDEEKRETDGIEEGIGGRDQDDVSKTDSPDSPDSSDSPDSPDSLDSPDSSDAPDSRRNMVKPMVKAIEIASPIKGKVLSLEDLQDAAFASGVLGKGAAVLPEEGKVYAPVDGTVTALFPTLHAIGIVSEEGVEVLIHIGLNTVQLDGRGFEAAVAQGDRVEKGQLMITFDREMMEAEGFCMETPVIITNSAAYLDVVDEKRERVKAGERLLAVIE